MEIKVKRLDNEIQLPEFAHEHDAAIDLRSNEESTLQPTEKKVILPCSV